MKLSEPIVAAGTMGWGWKVGSVVLGWFMSLILPVQPFLICIGFLVAVDVITGVLAARHRGERLSSAKMGRTIPKVLLYPLAVIVSELMVQTFFQTTPVANSLTYMVALFICAVEFQSAIENIGTLTGNDIWSQVKDRMGALVKPKNTPH